MGTSNESRSSEMGGCALVDSETLVNEVFAVITERAESKSTVHGIRSGMMEVDSLLGGFEPGELAVLAAAPGGGKTSFALTVAFAAARLGVQVFAFTPKMRSAQVGIRLMAQVSRVELNKLRTGRINEDDWEHIADAATLISKLDMQVSDGCTPTVESIAKSVRERKSDGADVLVIVDDIEFVAAGGDDQKRWTPDMSSIAFGLKRMAMELGVAVLATCGCGAFNTPVLFHQSSPHEDLLCRMGGVSAVADDVFWLDWYQDDTTVDAVVAKSRHGYSGRAKLLFIGGWSRFVDRIDDSMGDVRRSHRSKSRLAPGWEIDPFEPTAAELLARCFYALRVECGLKATLGKARDYVANKLCGNAASLVMSWDADAGERGLWKWGPSEYMMGFDVSKVSFGLPDAYRQIMECLCERQDGDGCVVVAKQGRIVMLLDCVEQGTGVSGSVGGGVVTDFYPITSIIDREDSEDLVLAWTVFQVWADKAGYPHDSDRCRMIAQMLANLERA